MMTNERPNDPFKLFREGLQAGGIEGLRSGLIGKEATLDGPFGKRRIIYADYVASGRALSQVESFVLERVLPYYANTHTESSFTGARTTELRESARQLIGKHCGADDDHAVVFCGSGATAGLNRLVNLCGIRDAIASGRPVRVVHGPYEHHSNILPWRESGAEVIEIDEDPTTGGPDLNVLRRTLEEAPATALLVGAFSAASNVTGVLTDVLAVTRVLQEYGAKSVWDYAGGGPYLPINMRPGRGVAIDAVSISPHKFIGGPGASGVLIVRKSACSCNTPSWPGGGTVKYVSCTISQYSDRIEDREEAGTPNIIGDIRAGLAFIVKEIIGMDFMEASNVELARRGIDFFSGQRMVTLLGDPKQPRLPVFSVIFSASDGSPVHYQFATRLVSDLYGIQARGGCSCAGPYGHRLLGFDNDEEARLYGRIMLGHELEKPGWVRINLSPLMTDKEIDYILSAFARLGEDAMEYAGVYEADAATGTYLPRHEGHTVAARKREEVGTLSKYIGRLTGRAAVLRTRMG